MNFLESYFNENSKRLIHKWRHYFEIYDAHFARYRGKNPVVLEVGVSQGGSQQMWKSYFGEGSTIIGLDIDPECKKLEEPGIQIHIGSQSDRQCLRELKKKIPKVDILIDDGGHTMEQQIVTFEEMYDHIKDDGIYLCEDMHTSYWIAFGGGYRRRGTMIEYCKNFVDYINAWHSEQPALTVNGFTRSAHSVHFYDSIVVVQKRKMEKPYTVQSGNLSFIPQVETDIMGRKPPSPSLSKRAVESFYYRMNRLARFFRLPHVGK
jgi:hypothetical protein